MCVPMYVRRITYPFDDIISCSFPSSEHQGNYANKRIRRASRKANLSQGFSLSLLSFYFIFFSTAVTVDICVNYQCNHGTCQKDRGTQPYCSCYEGYGGSRCETQIGMFIDEEKKTRRRRRR